MPNSDQPLTTPSELLSPVKIGPHELANRVVMAPLTRGRAGLSRLANEYMKEYYEMRASAGLIISEGIAISRQGYGWYGTAGMYTQEQCDSWKPVIRAIHARGGKIFLQLWHLGRQAHSSFNEGQSTVAASAIGIGGDARTRDIEQRSVPYEVPRALETEEIPGIVQDYVRCAAFAKEAGFDGVEVHAANGYLIDSFLQSSTNKRTDGYGGPKEQRFRILAEVVEALFQVYPSNQIGVKLSPNGTFGGMGSADNFEAFTYYAAQLNKYNLAYLHVMDGVSLGYHNLSPRVRLSHIRALFQGPIIGNVGYTQETAEGAVRTGAVDLIAFGRPFLSNPDLVERFQNNWPLEPSPPYAAWYGRTPDAKDSLEGYLTYRPYVPPSADH